MVKKAKKVNKKAQKEHKSPVLSTADRAWLAEVMAASLRAQELMLKKEPRSQKRRG